MLSQDDTNRILSTIKPDFVFTGDQHNLCHFKRVQNGSIIEDVLHFPNYLRFISFFLFLFLSM